MDKYSMQDVQNINNTCFKLNSLQLNALLSNYHCAPDEPYIPPVSWTAWLSVCLSLQCVCFCVSVMDHSVSQSLDCSIDMLSQW